MRLRRHARSVLALALLSAACSGPAGGGGAAAPAVTTTTPAALPGSIHDTVPPDPDSPVPPTGPTSPGSSSPRAAPGTTGGNGSAPTTTTALRGTSPTTTAAPTTTLPPGLPPEHCPEPKTCRRYGFVDGTPLRWRAGADGRVTIPYRINPSGSTTLTPEQIEGAIRAAFDTWERAAPAVRFVYQGRTTMQATPKDGVNVIAFNGPTIEHTLPGGDHGYVTEFDMLYTPNGWTWAPCQQKDNSCTPHNVRTPIGIPRDLQSIATHAAGHALWLGDREDTTLDRYLTMNPGNWSPPLGSRFWSTLALGDVLGVRALYPCSCPLPPIYDP